MRRLNLIFLALLLLSLILRLLAVLDYQFAFTWDQARDLIDIRRLVFGFRPLLVGPTTGLTGVFLGPFWYYFNALPLLVSQGDPTSLIIWEILWFELAGVFIFFFYRRFAPFNFILALLFLFSPLYFHTTQYSLNPNLLPLVFLLIVSILPRYQKVTPLRHFFLLGLLIGIALQIEAAFAILFVPLILLYFIRRKLKSKSYLASALGLSLTLIPQLLYELRHNFSMTTLVLNQLSGREDYLKNPLPFAKKLGNLLFNYQQNLTFSFTVPWFVSLSVLIIALLFIFKNRHKLPQKLISTLKLLLIFYPSSFIFFLLYPFQIYLWYLHSLGIIYLFILSLAIYLALRHRSSLTLVSLIVFAFLVISGTLWQSKLLKANALPSDNPSNLKNRLSVIDWIYSAAQGKDFQVYTYNPAVYDLPYHYLFWWYGPKQYGYHPATVHYQKDATHYLPDNDRYFDKKLSPSEVTTTFLILEPGDHQLYKKENWLNQFNQLCLQQVKQFNFTVEVRVLDNCPKQ